MGTSISQSSPRTSNWKPVHACYTNDIIPEEKTISEVWRAADNPTESIRWSNEIKSDIIYSCYNIIQSSANFQEALNKFNDTILSTKSNSIVTEFAKRSIPIAYQGGNPTTNWANRVFLEITNYIVSRDTSGFVGENYRNKTVKDLNGFKQRLNTNLNQILRAQQLNIKSRKEWNSFVDSTITSLKLNV